jgi:pyrimidine-nucleoside phosphorylase
LTHAREVHPLIQRKREGGQHSRAEITRLVRGYCDGTIDDETFTHWLTAVTAAGMTIDETAWLTEAMAHSGETIAWDGVVGTVVDKHSTGGVGDAVSLIAVPLAAACGVKVAKLSGRALGHTGGTIDKLECIPNLQTSLSIGAFKSQVAEVGCAIAAASDTLAPADKKMYALRHRTDTVASIPLIAASILSKKIAGGAPYLVIDVKAGRCAFMTTAKEARALAEVILQVGARLGRTLSVLVTDMDSPLASSIGDALELDEALQVLQGHAQGRLYEVALAVAEAMLSIRHAGDTEREPRYVDVLRRALLDGTAYLRFAEMARAQGGNLAAWPRPSRATVTAQAHANGVVTSIDGRAIAEAVAAAARTDEGHDAGVRLYKREGDAVAAGEPLFGVYGGASAQELAKIAIRAVHVGASAPARGPTILARFHADAIVAADL